LISLTQKVVLMKSSLNIRLQKIESRLGDPLKSKGIFLQTKEVNGQSIAWLIDVSSEEKFSSFYLAIILPVKKSNQDCLESQDSHFHRVTEDFLIKQPVIAQILKENNYGVSNQ